MDEVNKELEWSPCVVVLPLSFRHPYGKRKKSAVRSLFTEKAMKLFKWFFIAAIAWAGFLGASRAQDIVEPGMPNVDLEGRQFRKERMDIMRYCVLLELCCEIISLEQEAGCGDGSKSMFDLMPEQFAAECPPDFRKLYIDVLKEAYQCSKKNPLWENSPEGREMLSRLDDARKRFDAQYDLGNSMRVLIDWLDGHTMKRMEESTPELLKRLYQWKKELESGQAAISDDAGGSSAALDSKDAIYNHGIWGNLPKRQLVREINEIYEREFCRPEIRISVSFELSGD